MYRLNSANIAVEEATIITIESACCTNVVYSVSIHNAHLSGPLSQSCVESWRMQSASIQRYLTPSYVVIDTES
jgi:hypothetical protein